MNRSPLVVRWFSWTPGRWLFGIFVSLALGSVLLRAAYGLSPAPVSFPGQLTLQDGELAAQVVATPLWQVMEEISKLSGARIRWLSQDEEEAVSVEFPALPFSEALSQILGGKNFLLFYSSAEQGAKLTQIWISSRGTGGGQPVSSRQPVPEERTAPRAEEPATDIAQPLEVVIQTAMNDKDHSSRLSAIEYLGRHAREDARIKAILSQLAHDDSNPQVQDVASAALSGME